MNDDKRSDHHHRRGGRHGSEQQVGVPVADRENQERDLDWTLVVRAAYLVTMGVLGVRIAGRRLRLLLQP